MINQIPDGRGQHNKIKGEETRKRIVEFFASHPEAIQKDACSHLGITQGTLARHLKKIKSDAKTQGR